MYDLEGSDTGRKWVEIKNDSSSDIDITDWRFADVDSSGDLAKHLLYLPPANNSQGSMVILPGAFAILASEAGTFLTEHFGFGGTVIDTTIANLGQQDDRTYYVKIINKDGNEVNSVTYTTTQGGHGDGNSLQLSAGNWIAALPTPGAVNTSAVSEPPEASVSSGDSSNSGSQSQQASTTTPSTTQTTPSSSGGNHPVDPQIFSFIKGDKAAITGVESIFSGSTIGLDKKPIDGARYLWSFGDGTMREGQTVSHNYLIPGTYLIVLEVSVGDFNASSRQKITVASSGFSIDRVEAGSNGFISIKNSLSADVNISRWILRSAGKTFTFPSPTIILAGASVPFSNVVTGLESDPNSTELFYPNGTLAVEFEQKKEAVKMVSVKPVAHTVLPKVETAKPKVKEAPVLAAKEASTTQIEALIVKSEKLSSSTLIYAAAAGASGGYGDWVLALSGLIGVGVLVMIFSRRGSGVKAEETTEPDSLENSSSNQALTADDFEIIEEKEE